MAYWLIASKILLILSNHDFTLLSSELACMDPDMSSNPQL